MQWMVPVNQPIEPEHDYRRIPEANCTLLLEQLKFTLHLDTQILVGWSKPHTWGIKRTSTNPAVIPEKRNTFDKELKKQQANECVKLGRFYTADYKNKIITAQKGLVKTQIWCKCYIWCVKTTRAMSILESWRPFVKRIWPGKSGVGYVAWLLPRLLHVRNSHYH